ncbi:MAG: hypothetical protein ABH834_04550 [Candidatus Altiarchaeota archaeon]
MVVFLFSFGARAWGPAAHKFICEEAVVNVWGEDALTQCFPEGEPSEWYRFCVKYAPSPELTWDCLNYSKVYHPAVWGDILLGDKTEHVDYGECPVRSTLDAKYLCGDSDFRPAFDRALEWFNVSEGAESMCHRIYAFCVASDYFADSFFPTNRILGGYTAECASEMEDGVERKIEDRIDAWEVNSLCKIGFIKHLAGQNQSGKSLQQFRITDNGVEKIINELSAYGANISGKDYVTTSSTSTTSSTTTSTSTSSTTSSPTTLTEAMPAEEKEGEDSSPKKAFLAILTVAAIAGAIIYFKNKKMGGGGRIHALLSDTEHKHPTHLERV